MCNYYQRNIALCRGCTDFCPQDQSYLLPPLIHGVQFFCDAVTCVMLSANLSDDSSCNNTSYEIDARL